MVSIGIWMLLGGVAIVAGLLGMIIYLSYDLYWRSSCWF
uniref:Uncharacterized protein n=1 Tax=Pyramimonas orientalis virus TaxID=455367 RepID=A0A7M3UP43_POV01|nr:hypothetical protein HWQ62_00369 [Pyramimonas orientalis virus]